MTHPTPTSPLFVVATVIVLSWSGAVSADTLKVGPGATYTKINDAANAAKPGDVIEVQGDQTYAGPITFRSDHSGAVGKPITVRGIVVNGHRPILTGIGTGQYDNYVVLLNSDHFVMETFEVIGDKTLTNYCMIHKADDVLVRDLVVHDCLHQAGLVSTDTESGSITVEYSEFYHNGQGEESHQLYMATDEEMFPHSVFRLQYSYIHDGVGGNNVQSRAERNEIYSNWIEGAMYHELDLIGPDVGDEKTAREDSDIVGNVLVKSSEWRIARVGGDGSGNSAGRYRFVNNTMVLSDTTTSVIGLQETVETLEMYNNVIWGPKPGFKMTSVNEQIGPDTVMFGTNNWVMTGTTNLPATWQGTVMGADPGWVDFASHDLRPSPTSPLLGAGTSTTSSTGAQAFPTPLALPTFNAPQRRLIALGSAEARSNDGNPEIGAFGKNAAAPGPPPPDVGPGSGPVGGDGSSGGDGSGGGGGDDSGCGCRVQPREGTGHAWLAAIAIAAALAARSKRR